MDEIKLSWEDIYKIEKTVSKGDRVEIIPVRDGIKILRIRREEIQEKRPR